MATHKHGQTPTEAQSQSLAQAQQSDSEPAAGMYPSGHAGVAREWDGEIWASVQGEDPTASELHAPRRASNLFGRLPFWLVVIGVSLGVVLALFSAHTHPQNMWLAALAGLATVGGTVLAALIALQRKLAIRNLPSWRTATWWGIISGGVALGVAYVFETLFRDVVTKSAELELLMAGPIEELGKLLLPVILLLSGMKWAQSTRLGVWAVAVSGGVFGIVEGIKYSMGLAPESSAASMPKLDSTGLSQSTVDMVLALAQTLPRGVVELMHVFVTVGAAVLIWVAARKAHRVALTILVAWLLAAAIHSFNDGIITLLPASTQLAANALLILIIYLAWYRPLARRLVPPAQLAQVSKRWVPPLARHAKA